MQKDIIQKIELLVEMTDTNNHYESLKEELDVLEKEIEAQKSKISRLKKSMSDSKYMNASDRIIDENIKIGLENKIESYEKDLSDVLAEIESVSQEEEDFHQMVLDLENEINTSKHFLESLELKIKTIGSKDKSVYSFYEDLIDTTTKEIKSNDTRLQVKTKAYEQVKKRLESYGQKRFELEEKITKNKAKLEDTIAMLEDSESYVDTKAKDRDTKTLEDYEAELEHDEKRRLEIITDPAYIGHEAIALLMEEDSTGCLDKVKELVTLVLAKPYMDFRYEELDEILENAIQKRDEFANAIDGKKYDGNDNKVVTDRIEYLYELVESRKNEKEALEKKIREMDVSEVQKLMSKISDAKILRDTLKVDIEEYKKVMEENSEYKTPKKKASLNAAFHRKCDELDQVNEIIASYEQDLENLVEKSKELESVTLDHITKDIKERENEIKKYEKLKYMETSANDILAMEKDKSELKKLSDEVGLIEHRKKYMKTPNEIYDEIQIAITAEEEPIPQVKEDAVNLNDYRIEALEEEEPIEETKEEKIPVIEDVPTIEEPVIEDPKEETTEKVEENTQIEEKTPDNEDAPISLDDYVFPPRVSAPAEDAEVRYATPSLMKVISVEPINEEQEDNIPEPVKTEPIKPDDFMVNDEFEDTDYISFNELLEEGMKDGN